MRKEYWLLLLIIAIAAFLRLWNLPSVPPGLYPDEAMNGNNALEALGTAPPAGGWKVFYPENNGREGLFINIQSLFLAVFGNEPWVLRLPSALFGILTVLGVYFLTKELFKEDSNVALLAAFLLATSFWHINFSRIGFRAIMAPAFLTWGVYLLLLSLNKIQNAKVKNQNYNSKFKSLLLLPILAGATYGLGMHSYIAYRATPLLILFIIAAYWLKNKDKVIRRKILASSLYFLVSSIIVFLPLGIHFLDNPADFFGRTTQLSVFSSPTPLKDLSLNILKTAGMFNFAGDYNWRHNFSGQPELFWPVGIMFLIGILVAVISLFQNSKLIRNSKLEIRNSSLAILFVWLGVAALPVVISNEGIPHALRAIIMIPPVFILSGIGGVAIYNFFARKISARGGSAFGGNNTLALKTTSFILLLFILLTTYNTYFIRWAKNPNTAGAFAADYAEIGRQLNSLPPEQPKYVIVNASGVDVRGLPMPAQTVMFITDTFREAEREKKNIHYLLPNQIEQADIPTTAFVVEIN